MFAYYKLFQMYKLNLPVPGVLNPTDGALTPPKLCEPPKLDDDGWLYEYPCGLATAKAMHDKTTNTFIFFSSKYTMHFDTRNNSHSTLPLSNWYGS